MNTYILFPLRTFSDNATEIILQKASSYWRSCVSIFIGLQTFWIHSAPWIRTEALNQGHFIVSQRMDLLMNTSLRKRQFE